MMMKKVEAQGWRHVAKLPEPALIGGGGGSTGVGPGVPVGITLPDGRQVGD